MASGNPLRRWFEQQPVHMTMTALAEDIGIAQPYISALMDEKSERYPGLETAFAIEDYTGVTARAMYEFAKANRDKRAARIRKAALKGKVAA